MKPKDVMVSDLRDMPNRVSLAYDGWQFILGDEDTPIYVNKLVYYDMEELMKPFISTLTSMSLNSFFGLIACSKIQSNAGSEYSYIVFVQVNMLLRNDQYAPEYRIKYILTFSGKTDKSTSLYYDSDNRNICRVDGNANKLTVITRLPSM